MAITGAVLAEIPHTRPQLPLENPQAHPRLPLQANPDIIGLRLDCSSSVARSQPAAGQPIDQANELTHGQATRRPLSKLRTR